MIENSIEINKGIAIPHNVWKDIVIQSRKAYLLGYEIKDIKLNRKNKSLNIYYIKTNEISKDSQEFFMDEYFEKI